MDTTIYEKPTRPPTSSTTTMHGLPSGATLTDQPEVDLQVWRHKTSIEGERQGRTPCTRSPSP